MTIREYARIQTFPDDWQFCGAVASQYRQIGNAVPVNLAEALGRSLVALLNDIAKSEKSNVDTFFCIGAIHALRTEKQAGSLIQMSLLDADTLYLIEDNPVTLLGTYRKSCRNWIVDNNLYNYPVIDEQMDSIPQLLSVRRLILKRKNDPPLHFKVVGYSLVTKKKLRELNYKTSRKHPDKQRYLLYKLTPLA